MHVMIRQVLSETTAQLEVRERTEKERETLKQNIKRHTPMENVCNEYVQTFDEYSFAIFKLCIMWKQNGLECQHTDATTQCDRTKQLTNAQ